jgi:hypothetical protein
MSATWSTFVSHWTSNLSAMPAAVAAEIRREAVARLQERQRAGRGDTPLCFGDLVARIETAVAPR